LGQKEKMKKLLIASATLMVLVGCVTGNAVPSKDTAIQIAKAHWYKETGEEMDKDYPLQALSIDSIWVVTVRLPVNMLGGGPTVEIDKKTGKIISRYLTQ
jgi:hypothetical protein